MTVLVVVLLLVAALALLANGLIGRSSRDPAGSVADFNRALEAMGRSEDGSVQGVSTDRDEDPARA